MKVTGPYTVCCLNLGSRSRQSQGDVLLSVSVHVCACLRINREKQIEAECIMLEEHVEEELVSVRERQEKL